jgi:hypothetical protein
MRLCARRFNSLTSSFRPSRSKRPLAGETLKEFLARAVSHELGSAPTATERARVELPLVGSARPGVTDVGNAEIEATLAAEDVEKYGSQ